MFNSPWKAYRFIQRRIALKVTFFSIMLIKVKEKLESFLYLVQIILNIWSILTL